MKCNIKLFKKEFCGISGVVFLIVNIFVKAAYFIVDFGKINISGCQSLGMMGNNYNAFSDRSKKKGSGKVGNLKKTGLAMGIFLNKKPVFGIRAEKFMGKRNKNCFTGKFPQINLRFRKQAMTGGESSVGIVAAEQKLMDIVGEYCIFTGSEYKVIGRIMYHIFRGPVRFYFEMDVNIRITFCKMTDESLKM